MRVRATATGFDNIAVREVGDEFDMPDGSTAPWFEPVKKVRKSADAAAEGGADGAAGPDLS